MMNKKTDCLDASKQSISHCLDTSEQSVFHCLDASEQSIYHCLDASKQSVFHCLGHCGDIRRNRDSVRSCYLKCERTFLRIQQAERLSLP